MKLTMKDHLLPKEKLKGLGYGRTKIMIYLLSRLEKRHG